MVILKWKSNLLLIVALFVILLPISGCKKTQVIKPKFHGDYPTENLRQMWSYCHQNFRMKSPLTPLPLVSQMCDCYLDQMRQAHSQKNINNLSDNDTRAMDQNLIRVCNVKPEGQKI